MDKNDAINIEINVFINSTYTNKLGTYLIFDR